MNNRGRPSNNAGSILLGLERDYRGTGSDTHQCAGSAVQGEDPSHLLVWSAGGAERTLTTSYVSSSCLPSGLTEWQKNGKTGSSVWFSFFSPTPSRSSDAIGTVVCRQKGRKVDLVFLTRRQAAYIRLLAYRAYRPVQRLVVRFCTSHPFCITCYLFEQAKALFFRLRDWLGEQVRQSRDGQFRTRLHMFVWILAAAWLGVEGLYLIDANFHFILVDRLFVSWRANHQVINWILVHVRPVAVVVFLTWLREMANEWFRQRQDPVRSTYLIKSWVGLVVIVGMISFWIKHRFIFGESAQETTLFLLGLLVMKWLSRQATFAAPGKKLDETPKAKKTYSIISALLKLLMKRAPKK